MMSMTNSLENEKLQKRFRDGHFKLHSLADQRSFVDLADKSEEEGSSTSTSKRAKSSSSAPGHRASLPYFLAKSPIPQPKSRLSTPPDGKPSVRDSKTLVKKQKESPIRSPSWQRRFVEADDRHSPIPTRTATAASSRLSSSSPSSSTHYGREDASERLSKALFGTKAEDSQPVSFTSRSDRSKTKTEVRSNASASSSEGVASSNVAQKTRGSYGRERNHTTFLKSRNRENSGWSATSASSTDVQSKVEQPPSRPESTVQINIPSRRRSPGVVPSVSRGSLLGKFQQPLSKVRISRLRPAALKEARRQRTAGLIAELKKDTAVAQSRASSVEEIIGDHGLSEHYNDGAEIQTQHQALAQPKAKKTDRSKVKLDWSTAHIKTKTAFNPADLITPVEQVKRLLDAKFQDLPGQAPLTFVNNVNDKRVDGKFEFVDSYIFREECKIPPPPRQAGCDCSGECDPEDAACSCFLRLHDKPVPYMKRKDGLTVLSPAFIKLVTSEPQEIFECNDTCHCDVECFNRLVQRGRTLPLEIFMTIHCGFGLRSPHFIKKGQFIDAYLGEMLPTRAIEEYESATTEKSHSYVFSLDFFHNPAPFHVQGIHYGSPTRFINHSCNPNTRIFTVMMNHADQKIYKLAFFAIKDIPAMKEITFDYSPDTAEEEKWTPTSSDEDEWLVRCWCGERNCRGTIWPKRQVARRKGRGFARI